MFAIATLSLLTLLAPQEPDDVLAHYTLGGARRAVTRADVALEMAFHLRRRDRGRSGADVLVDAALTEREAKRVGVMPTKETVVAYWEDLKQQLKAAGRRPEDFAVVRNAADERWLHDFLSVQIAQDNLVRRELGLGPKDTVSGDMRKLWLSEARKHADVELDPDRLPIGAAARVAGREIPVIELGFLLLRTSEEFERERYVKQVVYLECIEALAAAHGIEITPADLDRAIDARRRQAQDDPRYRGVSFENLLEAQGLSVQALRTLRVFRAQMLLERLAAHLHPDDALREQIAGDREQVLAQVGPRRRIGVIFARAREVPNALIERTFEQAEQHLVEVRKRIAADGFAVTATIESEDSDSKQKGGDVGWHRRDGGPLPDAVRKAAFALTMTEVSMPVRGDEGVYLVTVLDKEPTPSEAVLIERLRKLRADELSEQLLVDAKVEFVGAQQDRSADKK